MDAIPKGVIMLFRGYGEASSVSSVPFHPLETSVGKICFLSQPSSRNYKTSSLFQKETVTSPYVKVFWMEISFKLLQILPSHDIIEKIQSDKSDIDTCYISE